MRLRFGVRGQLALVLVLSLGSLATLLLNSFTAFWLPQREQQAREQIRDASRSMAEAAEPVVERFSRDGGLRPLPGLDDRLAEVARRVLSGFPGVEGGFYLAGGLDQFTAYDFPTRPSPSPAPGPPPLPKPGPRDPPPLERPYIHAQARQSVAQDPGPVPAAGLPRGPEAREAGTRPAGPGSRPTTWRRVAWWWRRSRSARDDPRRWPPG